MGSIFFAHEYLEVVYVLPRTDLVQTFDELKQLLSPVQTSPAPETNVAGLASRPEHTCERAP